MKLNKFFFLLILSFFVTNCVFLTKTAENDKEKLLYAQLKFWENIRIDGIIEANYKSFVFRKNISIRKNKSAFRIDIYDSGIFGMQPAPFISAHYDSILTIRTPDQQINQLNHGNSEEFDLSIFFKLSDLYAIKHEIVEHQKFKYKDIDVIFSDDMKISEIRNDNNSTKITFNYFHNLDSITFYKEGLDIIDIQIDKISHPNQEIKRLK